MVRAWTSSQSPNPDARWGRGIDTKTPDWHTRMRLLEKVGQKSNQAWYWLGREGCTGLLPRTEIAVMMSEVKLSTLIFSGPDSFNIFGPWDHCRKGSSMSTNFSPYEFCLQYSPWSVMVCFEMARGNHIPRWSRDLIQVRDPQAPPQIIQTLVTVSLLAYVQIQGSVKEAAVHLALLYT